MLRHRQRMLCRIATFFVAGGDSLCVVAGTAHDLQVIALQGAAWRANAGSRSLRTVFDHRLQNGELLERFSRII